MRAHAGVSVRPTAAVAVKSVGRVANPGIPSVRVLHVHTGYHGCYERDYGGPRARGVKQTRVSRASRSAVPAKAHLGSAFTAGGRVDFNGQKLSLGVAASARSKSGGSRCVTTMAAKIAGYIKLAIEAGKANPAPPIGPALGAKVRLPER